MPPAARATSSKWRDDPAPVRLVVVGRDRQHGVDARLDHRLGQVDRVARVVGARAGRRSRPRRRARATISADELDLLLVGHRRRLAGRAGHHEPVRAVAASRWRPMRDRRLLVDRAVRTERRDHGGEQAFVGTHGAHCSQGQPASGSPLVSLGGSVPGRGWAAQPGRRCGAAGSGVGPAAGCAGSVGGTPGVSATGGAADTGAAGSGVTGGGLDRAAVLVVLDRPARRPGAAAAAPAVELPLHLVELGLRLLGHLLRLVQKPMSDPFGRLRSDSTRPPPLLQGVGEAPRHLRSPRPPPTASRRAARRAGGPTGRRT